MTDTTLAGIAARIADPGAHLPRQLDADGWPAETVAQWGARAVMAGLNDGTLGCVPAKRLQAITDPFNAGVNAAADAIEAHAESIGWYEGSGVWADVIEEARKAANA